MPQVVEIPDIGDVEFPDEMPHEEIAETIRSKIIPQRQQLISDVSQQTAAGVGAYEMFKLPYQADWSAVNEEKRVRALERATAAEQAFGEARAKFDATGGTATEWLSNPKNEALENELFEAQREYQALLPQGAPTYEQFAKGGGTADQYVEKYGPIQSANDLAAGEVSAGRQKAPGFLETAALRFLSSIESGKAELARTVAPSFGTAELAEGLQSRASEATFWSGLDKSTKGDVARGVGTFAGMLAGNPAGKPGMVIGALRAAADTRGQVIAQGGSPQEADAAAAKTFPMMLGFLAGSAAAAKFGGSLVGQEATALQRGLAGGGIGTAANVGMSAGISAIEGTPYTAENFTMDALFGVMGGMQAAKAKTAETLRELSPEEARIVATRGLDAIEAPATPTAPETLRQAGAESIATKTPTKEAARSTDQSDTLAADASAKPLTPPATKASPSLEQIRAEGVTPPDPNRELGPGAANIEEFGPQKTVGAKNASVDAQRAERGLPPLMSEARKADEATWENTEKAVEKNPELPRQITEDILSGEKKSVTDEEQSALLMRMIELRNSRDMEAERAKDPSLTPEEQAEHLANFERHEKDLQLTEEADRKIGTQSGRALRIRRLMANEDFTLAAMEARERSAKGEPLTPEETQRIKTEHDEIARLAKEQGKREAQLELEAEKKAVEAKIAEVGQYSPGLLERARKWIEGKEAQIDAGRERMRVLVGKIMGKASANPLPIGEALELTKILANEALVKLGRVGVDLAKFSADMISQFGEAVSPYLKKAWDMAQKEWDGSPAKPRKKTALADRESKDAVKNIEAIEGAIKETAGDKPTVTSLSKQIKELAREYVKAGADTVEKLETKLHEFFGPIIPGVTKAELRNEFSDYGKSKAAPTEPLKVKLSQLRQEAQKISQLQALEAKLAPLRTGQQRVEQSARARELTKQVNELKRQLGIVDGDPAKRLRSTLEAMQKRLENRISDLRYEIAKGVRSVKTKTDAPTNAKIDALKKELETVQTEHEAVFGKRQMSEESKKRTAIASAERSLKAAEAELADAKRGKFREPLKKGESKHAEVRAIQAKRDAIKAEVEALHDAAFPKPTEEQAAIARRKKQVQKQIDDLKTRIATEDFEARKRKPPLDISKDPEAVRLAAEKERIIQVFRKRHLEHQKANRTAGKKFVDSVAGTLAASRSLKTAFDISAPFRQGGFLAIGDLFLNPRRFARQFGRMIGALTSQRRFEERQAALKMRRNADLYEASKLALTDMGEKLTGREETMMSDIAERVPGVKASNRAYITFLNEQRADAFDAFMEMMGGRDIVTPEQAKFIAAGINDMTGRSAFSQKHAGAAAFLAKYLFSPRFLLSRVRTVLAGPVARGALAGPDVGAKVRVLMAMQYGRFALGLAALYGLSKLAGSDIENDPRSSDFGKMKFGNTRIDPMAGLQQVAVLLSRAASRSVKDTRGKIRPVTGQTFGNFVRGKLAPIPGTALDVILGKNVVGEKVTPASAAIGLVAPLAVPVEDFPQLMEEHGAAGTMAIEMLNLMGWGFQNYGGK